MEEPCWYEYEYSYLNKNLNKIFYKYYFVGHELNNFCYNSFLNELNHLLRFPSAIKEVST